MKFIDAGSSGQWGWHATELAMKCPQSFAYAYRVQWPEEDRPRTASPALLKGSLVHAGLAHHYAAQRDGEGIWAPVEEAIEHCALELGPAASDFVPVAVASVRAYGAHYAVGDLVPMHIEEVFEAEIGGWKFTQRLDLVARDASGRVVIVDHKTTSMLSPNTAQRYTLSGQFLGMATFGRQLWGKDFGGVLINLIEMPEGGSFRFRRVAVEPAPHALRLFPLTVKHARDRVAALDESGLDPWEWPKALSETVCTNAYGNCQWYEHCRWGLWESNPVTG